VTPRSAVSIGPPKPWRRGLTAGDWEIAPSLFSIAELIKHRHRHPAIAFHSLVLAILIKFVPQGCDRPRARAAVWRCDAAGRNRGILSVPRKLSGLAARIKNLCFEYRRHQRNPRFAEFCTFDCAFAAPSNPRSRKILTFFENFTPPFPEKEVSPMDQSSK
jgi:hypothetical protein